MGVNISIGAETVVRAWGFPVTNTLLTSVLVTLLLLAGVFAGRSRLGTFASRARLAGTVVVWEILKLVDSATGSRSLSKKVFPIVATFFIFIVTANLIALVPGFLGSFYAYTDIGRVPLLRSPNSDINTTVALSIIAVLGVQYFAVRESGIRAYLRRFFDFRGPVRLITGFFELLSEAIKLLSFSFRLFGNVFAGEVLLLVAAFLLPYVLPLPFMVLEVFVGVIQAFIFGILSLTFIRAAIASAERSGK